jgi:hypothetical protein
MKLENDLIELISVSLEIPAFFFVTTDLYGEERLERLTVRLLSVAKSVFRIIQRQIMDIMSLAFSEVNKAYDALFKKFGLNSSSDDVVVPEWVSAITMFFGSLFSYYIFMFLFTAIRNPDSYPTGFFRYGLIIFTIIGLLLTAYLAIGSAIIFLSLLLRWVILLGLYLIRLMKLQGILLTIGTILFIISKGMIWWNAFYKLSHHGS